MESNVPEGMSSQSDGVHHTAYIEFTQLRGKIHRSPKPVTHKMFQSYPQWQLWEIDAKSYCTTSQTLCF